jgi:hypothetical protein
VGEIAVLFVVGVLVYVFFWAWHVGRKANAAERLAADRAKEEAERAKKEALMLQAKERQALLEKALVAARSKYPDLWDRYRLVDERDWSEEDDSDDGYIWFTDLLEVPPVIATYGGGLQIELWPLDRVENAEKHPRLAKCIRENRYDRMEEERERFEEQRRAEEARRVEEQRAEEERRIEERRQRQLAEQIVVDLKDIESRDR